MTNEELEIIAKDLEDVIRSLRVMSDQELREMVEDCGEKFYKELERKKVLFDGYLTKGAFRNAYEIFCIERNVLTDKPYSEQVRFYRSVRSNVGNSEALEILGVIRETERNRKKFGNLHKDSSLKGELLNKILDEGLQ